MGVLRRLNTSMGKLLLLASGLLLLLLALMGAGIGITVWLGYWHSDFVELAEQAGLLNDPVLQDMLDTLNSRAGVMTVVISVIAAIELILGVAATVLLGRMIGRPLGAAVRGIADSAAELLAVSSQVAAATAQTAAATNETTATVEEVKQTATLAQEKAAEASGLSQEVVDASIFGAESAKRNYAHFEQIKADTDVVTEAIGRLNEEVQSVGDVMVTVNDLAEQSNLLSVNASIEAAKAGEAGKGFTVVAQEVKSLAEQSQQGVSQTKSVLEEIQKASGMVVRAVEQTRETVGLGREEANKAVENIGARVDMATKAAEATEQISATSSQQLSGMEQISNAVLSIDEAGKQSVAGTHQVEKEVEQLQKLALGLRRLMEANPSKEG